jgi:hypothetical protein
MLTCAALVACVRGVDPDPPNQTGGTGGNVTSSSSGFVGPGGGTATSSATTTNSSSSSTVASSSSAGTGGATASSSSAGTGGTGTGGAGTGGAGTGGTGTGGSGAGGAPPTGLRLQYKANDTNPTDNQMKPVFQIMNDGTSSVPLTELTIRYWYTLDGGTMSVFYCDYATVGCGNITGSFVMATGMNADQYILVGFSGGAGSISPVGNSGEIQTRIQRSNFTAYNESNDYSFDPTKTSFTDWTKVTLYRNGSLVWGTEP